MENEVSKLRLYAMRVVFLLTFVAFVPGIWQEIITTTDWDPFYGVTVSFWAALSILSILGVLYPVKMLPLLLLQMSYKTVWLLGVGLPMWQQGNLDDAATGLLYANLGGVILDVLVIPWVYVAKNYFYKPVW